MNFFQRLSYLKKWHDDNYAVYLHNRNFLKDAFNKKYKHELKRYVAASKELKNKRKKDILSAKSIEYSGWVEGHFQKLLKKLSQTTLDFQRGEMLQNFDLWVKEFAPMDYKFRLHAIEQYYKNEIERFHAQFDLYINTLQKDQADWLLEEDERYNSWLTKHPFYIELQELEFQYDQIADDTIHTASMQYNDSKKNLHKIKDANDYHPRNVKKFSTKYSQPKIDSEYVEN